MTMNISVGCLAKVEGSLLKSTGSRCFKNIEYIVVGGISICPFNQQRGCKPSIQL
jgi:hypothetical protein